MSRFGHVKDLDIHVEVTDILKFIFRGQKMLSGLKRVGEASLQRVQWLHFEQPFLSLSLPYKALPNVSLGK
jgi:hypothetical protein